MCAMSVNKTDMLMRFPHKERVKENIDFWPGNRCLSWKCNAKGEGGGLKRNSMVVEIHQTGIYFIASIFYRQAFYSKLCLGNCIDTCKPWEKNSKFQISILCNRIRIQSAVLWQILQMTFNTVLFCFKLLLIC